MPSETPRRALLAVLLVTALGLFAPTPSSAEEPALPQFDPASIVKLENGLNWADLNGDGVEDLVVSSRLQGASRSWDFFDFHIVERGPYMENGEELALVKHPGISAQAADENPVYAGDACQHQSLRPVRRQGQSTGALTAVESRRVPTGEATTRCDAMPVEFKIYELVANSIWDGGLPFRYSYELRATLQSRDRYVESYLALEELGLE